MPSYVHTAIHMYENIRKQNILRDKRTLNENKIGKAPVSAPKHLF